MAVPYDSERILDNIPGGSGAYINRTVGVSPPLDSNSSSKASNLLSQRPTAMFGGNSTMSYNPTIYDNSSSGLSTYTINRSTGSSYPDGSGWQMPSQAGSPSDTGTQGSSLDDSHCVIIDWTNRRSLCMRQFYNVSGSAANCYSGSAHNYDEEFRGFMVSPPWADPEDAPGAGNGSPGTGCGLNILGGLLLPEDIDLWFFSSNTVRHGLRFTANTSTVSTGTIYPAWKTDGSVSPGTSTVKQAQYVWLDATDAEISAISGSNSTIAGFGRMVATMLRQFGGQCQDRSGGGFRFYAAHLASWSRVGQPNPWQQRLGHASPSLAFSQVTNFPWSKLRVLSEAFVPEEGGGGPGPTPTPPAAPVSHTGSVNGQTVTLVVRLKPDPARTRMRLIRRTEARVGTLPLDDPTPFSMWDTSAGAVAGTIEVGSTKQNIVSPEIILVRSPIPFAGTYEMSIYIDADGPSSGTALMKGIVFPENAGTGLPDGQSRTWLGNEVPFADSATEGWYLLGPVTIPAGGNYWVGYISGGTSTVIRRSRNSDGVGERFIDSGLNYASPPTTCPTTGAGSLRTSIAFHTMPGGDEHGGLISVSENLPPDEYFFTAYTEGPDGTALLDSTPASLTTSAGQITGTAEVSGTSSIIVSGEKTTSSDAVPASEVVGFDDDPVELAIYPWVPWHINPDGTKDRKVTWVNPPGEWRYLEEE